LILNATGPGSTPHELDDTFRLRRSGIVTVALGVVCLRAENHDPNVSFTLGSVASQHLLLSETRPLVASDAIKPHFAVAQRHHPPASESYFPQEARGFVQLNSFSHPLPSSQHACRSARPYAVNPAFAFKGCGKESYELGGA
jgi:hypothetical protein